jgi:DNA-binding NtrC family response regulator
MSRVILLGLPEDLAAALGCVLVEDSHEVKLSGSLQDVRRDEPEVVFVSADGPEFPDNVSWLRETEPDLPVVVVTRLPESSRWLDALEAGAKDYCGAPFEHVQMRWIMETVCPQTHRQAAA